MEEDNSWTSGAALLGRFLSFDESIEGATDCPGLKLGFNVILGRLFLVSCDDFEGEIKEDFFKFFSIFRREELAANTLFKALIPEVCLRTFKADISTNGVLLSGFVVRCRSG